MIEKALSKVREDKHINKAIDVRKEAKGSDNPTSFKDEMLVQLLSDLPPRLQPNPEGLTESQFQVYEDFDRITNFAQ